jgi:hypothetical protein
MYVVLAFVLMLIPLGALYVLERLAAAGKGPLADPGGMVVLDGTILPMPMPMPMPMPVPVPGLVHAVPPDDGWKRPSEVIDDEACTAESRLVAALISGELDRAQYQERMADLAVTDSAIRPVRLPPTGSGA